MQCCCPHSQSANRIFSFFAKRYRKRFAKSGFEASQQQLLQGLTVAGYQDMTLLEVGCGVGHLHQTLLERGAQSAVGIELAEQMIVEARNWAEQRELGQRTHYIQGDFMEISDSLESADNVILDKVICCYPDADGLVHRSLDKSQQVYAITIPRDRWYISIAIGLGALIMKLLGSDFRPYLHSPEQIEAWITAKGYKKIFQRHTFIWLSQVYQKQSDQTGN